MIKNMDKEATTFKKNNWDNLQQGKCPQCYRDLKREVKKVTKHIKTKKPLFGDGGLLDLMVDHTEEVQCLVDRMRCICGFRINTDKYQDLQKGKDSMAYKRKVALSEAKRKYSGWTDHGEPL